MSAVLYFAVIAVALLVLMLAGGLLLPQQITATRTKVIAAPIESVFSVVADPLRQTNWRDDLAEVIAEDLGQWTEVPKNGPPIHFQETRREAPRAYELKFFSRRLTGEWRGRFEAVPEGTRVVFTETVFIGNPFLRIVARVVRFTDSFMDAYLAALKRRLASPQ